MRPHPLHFTAGDTGAWTVTAMTTVCGEPLPAAKAIAISAVATPGSPEPWVLRGTSSNLRYTSLAGATQLRAVQSSLGRPGARCAALIPIRKRPEWWALAQDQRDAVFRQARHHDIGVPYVAAIARALYHSRELGEPFDFLTWFEFAAENTPAFDRLLVDLRASAEWAYVDREIDIRLSLDEDAFSSS
ncbi:MAG: chlorite dismutase family protein [Novosphingobium sp.]